MSLEASVDTGDASLSDDAYKQVVSLLKLVQSSAARSADASALLKDELATVIQKGGLNRQVEVGWCGNELVCQGCKVKRFERSGELGTALFKIIPLFFVTFQSIFFALMASFRMLPARFIGPTS